RIETGAEDNYSQVTIFWSDILNEEERARLVANIAGHLKDANDFIQKRAVKNFTEVHPDFGSRLEKALEAHAKAHL
ncbi:catalase-related domain-containing protein, partial [Salmonella sp. s51933]|uniref:catalase-related domain-containing protein n=1 Tax=Salmonella sp. s51933 TaxID=3160127 RepID=UPI0037550A08